MLASFGRPSQWAPLPGFHFFIFRPARKAVAVDADPMLVPDLVVLCLQIFPVQLAVDPAVLRELSARLLLTSPSSILLKNVVVFFITGNC